MRREVAINWRPPHINIKDAIDNKNCYSLYLFRDKGRHISIDFNYTLSVRLEECGYTIDASCRHDSVDYYPDISCILGSVPGLMAPVKTRIDTLRHSIVDSLSKLNNYASETAWVPWSSTQIRWMGYTAAEHIATHSFFYFTGSTEQ